MSAVYTAAPVTLAGPSTRGCSTPITLVLMRLLRSPREKSVRTGPARHPPTLVVSRPAAAAQCTGRRAGGQDDTLTAHGGSAYDGLRSDASRQTRFRAERRRPMAIATSFRQELEAAVMERHCANHPMTEKWARGELSRN